jgi:hypothetical protein
MKRALPDHQEYLDPTNVRRFKEEERRIQQYLHNRTKPAKKQPAITREQKQL